MERDYIAERMPMFPLDFAPSRPHTPAFATFPKPPTPNVAFYGEKRSHYKKQVPQPTAGGHHILFRNPAFKRDVQDFFGNTSHGKGTQNTDKHITGYFDDADVAPVYKAEDDDLAVWKERIEAGTEVKDNGEAGKEKCAEHVLTDNFHQEVPQYGRFENEIEDASEAGGVWSVSG
jgi:hypothetical protein